MHVILMSDYQSDVESEVEEHYEVEQRCWVTVCAEVVCNIMSSGQVKFLRVGNMLSDLSSLRLLCGSTTRSSTEPGSCQST